MPGMLHGLLGDWSAFGIVTKLIWLVQLGLLIHVFKTGRPYWWYWILIGAPALGGIVYFVVEVLPEMQVSGPRGGWKPRAWRIRELRAELEETETVKLRLALAEEVLASGDAVEALAIAEPALSGVFRDDPHTLAAVARFRLENGKYAEALAALDKVNFKGDRMLETRVALYRGRALVLAGRHAEAQAVLTSLDGRHIGDEPRYFLALSLQQTGKIGEARALWEDIRKRFRRASRAWRRTEKPWFKLAGVKLKETRG